MSNTPTIAGIQQIGIGVPDVQAAFTWYRRHLGMDVPVFEDAAEANLMLPYTGGKPHQRHAILALNMRGGGGFEIWQYTSRTPQPPAFQPALGDYGFLCAKMKSVDVRGSFEYLSSKGVRMLSGLEQDPSGMDSFFLQDPWGNIFQVVKGESWFSDNGTQLTGGPVGCMVGVSDIERSRRFYAEVLGYDTVVYDKEGVFEDLAGLPGGQDQIRRVLLRHSQPRVGAFSQLLGSSEIELIRVAGRTPRKIFGDRFWGDLGFIHLCFDINHQDAMKARCQQLGYPYTVDSGSTFDMGEAAGRFSYIEDPDGALIEFVETKRIPLVKKIGWYLNLEKRDPGKPLPRWMLKTLGFARVKD